MADNKTDIVSASSEPLTEKEVLDVLNFANAYYTGITASSQYNTSVFTPFLTNERLSQIGLKPKKANKSTLERQFSDPVGNQKQLVGYSEYLKFTEAVSKRTLLYYGNLPSFDYTFTCVNAYTADDLNSPEYKADFRRLQDFLRHFNVRGQFAYATRRMLESDAFYSVFRVDGENYEFQELPYDYCLITGRNLDWGFVFDFDMQWFLQQGLSLNQYPPNFKVLWRRVFGDREDLTDYNPSNGLKKRKGTFATWAQTSPLPSKGGFTCFKFNSDGYATIPFLSPLFADAINKPVLRYLQQNQYIIASQKLLVGLIPLLKDQKSGQVADALAVKAETLGKFLGLLKQGLADAIKVGGVPFSDLKDISFEQSDKSIYDEYNKNLAKQSGATSSLIYGSDRPTATEVSLSAQIDEMIATSIYPQFEKWLSTYVNSLTKKYKFKFRLEGTKFQNSRKERLDTALKLASVGIVLPQKIAAAIGMDAFELESQLQMHGNDSFRKLLYLLPNSNTANLGGEVGRATVDDTEAAESTLSKLDRVAE